MSSKGIANLRGSVAPPSARAPKLRLLSAISALLCAGGLAACSRPLAGPVASLPSSTVSADAAAYATSDETSPRGLARIYPLAGSRPSRASPKRTAQAPSTNQVVPEPEGTGAVAPRMDAPIDSENGSAQLAMEEQYRGWDAVAQRATGRVCTGC
jgi:hypothetical protein